MTLAPARPTEAAGRFTIVEVTPQNAHLVPEILGRGCGSFADPALQDAAAVADMIRAGRQLLFVGRDGAGTARGIIGMAFSMPTRAVAEVGLIVTDPALAVVARGRLLRALMRAVMTRVRGLVEDAGLRALVSSEVTSHSLSQRLVQRAGFSTTGIIPGAPTRAGETISVRCFPARVEPYAVAVPSRFADLLRTLYASLRLPVSFERASPPRGCTVVSERHHARRGLTVLELIAAGSDAPAVLGRRLARCRDEDQALLVVLPLAALDLEPAVEALSAGGMRYAAFVPFWRGHDALMLQSVDWDGIDLGDGALHAPLARRIMAEIAREEPPQSLAVTRSGAATPP